MSDAAGPRRRSTHVSSDNVDDVDEQTFISSRRGAVAEPADDEGFEENTVIGSRRSVAAGAAAESDSEAATDVDEATVIGRRRSAAASPELPTDDTEPDGIEATQIGGRRAARLAAAAEQIEPTDPGRRRAQVDDATAVSKRKIEATIKSLRKPKINPPAKIETLSLASRRTTQILDGQPVSREAFTPEQAILKAPYKPRKQTIIPVVHLDRQLDTRPPKPFAESMTALARQRSAARRRIAVMAAVGGGTIVLSVGGIIALLLLG